MNVLYFFISFEKKEILLSSTISASVPTNRLTNKQQLTYQYCTRSRSRTKNPIIVAELIQMGNRSSSTSSSSAEGQEGGGSGLYLAPELQGASHCAIEYSLIYHLFYNYYISTVGVISGWCAKSCLSLLLIETYFCILLLYPHPFRMRTPSYIILSPTIQ